MNQITTIVLKQLFYLLNHFDHLAEKCRLSI